MNSSEILAGLRSIGISSGDVLLVHSSLKSFGQVEGGADAVIDALIEAVGPKGLVSLPTHTWGTVNKRQPVFHETLSHSIVGHITNVFRARKDVLRSLHPTHSVAAWGARAKEFIEGHETQDTPCSRNSPYGRLAAWGGKVLSLGVNLNTCTLIHGYEEWAGVPWLFDKEPEILWTVREDGGKIKVPSRRHAWSEALDRKFSAFEPWLKAQGALKEGKIGPAPVLILDAKKGEELFVPLLRKNPDVVLGRGVPAA